VILTMPVDGVMRQVRVPEHEVVLPLEYFMQNGECLPEAQAEYTRLAKKPIDVKPDPKGGYFTFSERDKYRCVMHQAAYLKLLRATGVNRTC
ncbi:MAG TPA: hypothetical protein VLA88_01270, partial [Candidatus Saccharimonadales bacterium]|nr:hypothetical protein [Candidatus Saccharimonadales bacterium]